MARINCIFSLIAYFFSDCIKKIHNGVVNDRGDNDGTVY